jgi:uncharacterized membrane protein YfhO
MKLQRYPLLHRNRFVLLACGMGALGMLIVYFCTQMFPIGDNSILRMDLYHQYGPLFAELYDRIFGHGSLTYSWTSGLGACFLGNYFNYLSSPIGAIVVFFGHKHVPEAIAAMILIKAALSAGAFTWYLKRSVRSHSLLSASFGLLYAFCAYMLAYYWNVMWLDAMVLLPVLLYGIERIIDEGKNGLYLGTLALSMFSNYYMSYMLCIFSVLYFLYYFFSRYSFSSAVNAGYAKRHRSFGSALKNNRFLRAGALFALASVGAAGLMACVLLPTYRILQNCSATGGTFPQDVKSYFTIFDFFANHFTALETTIRSSGDDVLPNVYCGALTLILAPLYFFTHSISKKEKAATLVLLGALYASFNLNFLNYVWHGLHFPNDLPYRFSFMYSFVLLVIAYKTLLRLHEFSARQIAVAAAAVGMFCVIVQDIKSKNVTDMTVYFTLALLAIYTLLLTLFKDKRFQAASVALLVSVAIGCEVIACDTHAFPNTVTLSSYAGDYDDFRLLKEDLDTVEQDGFYRMELTYLRTRMDNSWFGYNGVSVFSSMAYEKLAKLESRMGMMSNKINSYTYNAQTPVYNMMHALRYVVNNTEPNVLSAPNYKPVTTLGKFEAFRNLYELPLGFLVDPDVEFWNTDDTDPFSVQEDFFTRASGVEGTLFRRVPLSFVNYANVDPFTEDLEGGRFYFRKSDRKADSDASATFTLEAQEDANLYLYFQVDGGSSKNITISSFLGTHEHSASHPCILDLGYHEKGEAVNVTIPFEQESGYVTFEVCTMDHALFERGFEKLQDGAMALTEFGETKLTGTFTAKKKSILYLSIPDDSGWLIELDGEPLKPHDRVAIGDALIGVRVGKGNHTISMKYEVPGGVGGLMVSAFTLCVMLCVWLVLWLRRRKNKKRLLPAFPRRSRKVFIGCLYPAPKRESPVSEPPNPKKEVFAPPVEVITLPPREAQAPQQPPAEAPQPAEPPHQPDAPQDDAALPEAPTETE